MKNFIELNEVQFSATNKSEEIGRYSDYIRPSEIIFMELISRNRKTYTKIHFGIGSEKCSIFVAESPEEIDKLIENFYKNRKTK